MIFEMNFELCVALLTGKRHDVGKRARIRSRSGGGKRQHSCFVSRTGDIVILGNVVVAEIEAVARIIFGTFGLRSSRSGIDRRARSHGRLFWWGRRATAHGNGPAAKSADQFIGRRQIGRIGEADQDHFGGNARVRRARQFLQNP